MEITPNMLALGVIGFFVLLVGGLLLFNNEDNSGGGGTKPGSDFPTDKQ